MSKSTKIAIGVLATVIVVLLATVAALVGGLRTGGGYASQGSPSSVAVAPDVRSGETLMGAAPQPTDASGAAKSTAHGLGYSGKDGQPLLLASTGDVAPDATSRLIVRNQSLRMKVKKVEPAVDGIRALAKRYNGLVTDVQVASDSGGVMRPLADGEASFSDGQMPLSGWVTVRVPVARFDAFVDDARKLGVLQGQTQSTDDVTQQHVDLVARLDNLTAHERQLRTFFARAKNVAEMLSVEGELSRVRGEIESLTAEKEYLERQAALATVTIELVEPAAVVRPAGYDWGVSNAFTTGIRALVGTFNAIIIFTLGALPLLLIAALIIWPARALARRRATRRQRVLAETKPDEAAEDTELFADDGAEA